MVILGGQVSLTGKDPQTIAALIKQYLKEVLLFNLKPYNQVARASVSIRNV